MPWWIDARGKTVVKCTMRTISKTGDRKDEKGRNAVGRMNAARDASE
jgi:hypothetical protein